MSAIDTSSADRIVAALRENTQAITRLADTIVRAEDQRAADLAIASAPGQDNQDATLLRILDTVQAIQGSVQDLAAVTEAGGA